MRTTSTNPSPRPPATSSSARRGASPSSSASQPSTLACRLLYVGGCSWYCRAPCDVSGLCAAPHARGEPGATPLPHPPTVHYRVRALPFSVAVHLLLGRDNMLAVVNAVSANDFSCVFSVSRVSHIFLSISLLEFVRLPPSQHRHRRHSQEGLSNSRAGAEDGQSRCKGCPVPVLSTDQSPQTIRRLR